MSKAAEQDDAELMSALRILADVHLRWPTEENHWAVESMPSTSYLLWNQDDYLKAWDVVRRRVFHLPPAASPFAGN